VNTLLSLAAFESVAAQMGLSKQRAVECVNESRLKDEVKGQLLAEIDKHSVEEMARWSVNDNSPVATILNYLHVKATGQCCSAQMNIVLLSSPCSALLYHKFRLWFLELSTGLLVCQQPCTLSLGWLVQATALLMEVHQAQAQVSVHAMPVGGVVQEQASWLMLATHVGRDAE
jgi:hypothetical protein